MLGQQRHYQNFAIIARKFTALDIWERVQGPDHLEVALALNHLAKIYSTQGKYAEAKSSCQRALTIYQRSLGFSDEKTREAQALYESIVRAAEM